MNPFTYKGWLFTVLYQSIFMKSWLEGKRCQQQGWLQPLDDCQAKPIQELGGASQGVDWGKSHYAQMCPWKWATNVAFLVSSHFWTIDNVRSILPESRRKRTGQLLSGNFAFHLEIKVSESGGRVERDRIQVGHVLRPWNKLHEINIPIKY